MFNSKEIKMTEQVQTPTLTFQDLTMLANIIDLAVQRGAFKGAEAETVGQQFNKLVAIIKAIQPPQADDSATQE
jgi:hypothetical protein